MPAGDGDSGRHSRRSKEERAGHRAPHGVFGRCLEEVRQGSEDDVHLRFTTGKVRESFATGLIIEQGASRGKWRGRRLEASQDENDGGGSEGQVDESKQNVDPPPSVMRRRRSGVSSNFLSARMLPHSSAPRPLPLAGRSTEGVFPSAAVLHA
ncbi:hypothetical protein NMY22_g4303 [Coprinellus aureogranulatus]|nr:hypothetical protein NMY22_g4303 [Coprinellus aureogranulatus]